MIPSGNREAVEVCRAEHEGARPIGKTAGHRPGGGPLGSARLEKTCVNLRWNSVAQHGAKGAANHVGAFSGREIEPVEGAEMKPETVELEGGHDVGGSCGRTPVV